MPKFRLPSMVFVFAFISSLTFAHQADSVLPQIQIKVKQNVYGLEYADTFALRAQGLMHREKMCDSCGMLFNFKQTKHASMWMKNTYIPLDMIFLDGTVGISANKAHPRVMVSLWPLYLGALPSAADEPLHRCLQPCIQKRGLQYLDISYWFSLRWP